MFKNLFLSISFIFLFTLSAFARPLSLSEIYQAGAKISTTSASGSGTVVYEDRNYYYLLTNAHVVGNSRTAYAEFYRNGYKTGKISGYVVWSERVAGSDIDFAVVAVAKSNFRSNPPRVIPLAPETYRIQSGQYISSVGCPSGRWLQGWEGHSLTTATSRIQFTPPPLGGQSGSGIFVTINDETYVGAVLTWRIGSGGQDRNGHDIARGGAIPISTLFKVLRDSSYQPVYMPNNYIPIANEDVTYYEKDQRCELCNRCRHQHLTGTDGKVYCEYFPDGVELANGRKTYEKCEACSTFPFGNRRPKPNGPSPPDNQPPSINPPGRGLPPGFGRKPPKDSEPPPIPDPPTPDTGEIDQLKAQIVELEGILKQLEEQRDKYLKDNAALKSDIAKLTDQIQTLRDEIWKLDDEGGLKDEDIKRLKLELKDKLKTILDLNIEINKGAGKEKVIEDLEKLNDDIKNQRNVGFGAVVVFILAAAVYFAGRAYKNKGRPIVQNEIDKVQDKIQKQLEEIFGVDLAGSVREGMEGLEDRISQAIDKLIDKHSDKWEGRIQEKLPVELIDKILEALIDLKNKDEAPAPIPPPDINIINQMPNIPEKDRVIDPGPVKDKEGVKPQSEEKIEVPSEISEWSKGKNLKHWARFGMLYKEAVDQLRKGNLYFKHKVKLQGQQITADRIDKWVRSEYINRMDTDAILSKNSVWHDAYLGELYRKAIGLLREGKFNVLGAINTADTIDNWVQTKLLDKLL